jgi:hypothetical protein
MQRVFGFGILMAIGIAVSIFWAVACGSDRPVANPNGLTSTTYWGETPEQAKMRSIRATVTACPQEQTAPGFRLAKIRVVGLTYNDEDSCKGAHVAVFATDTEVPASPQETACLISMPYMRYEGGKPIFPSPMAFCNLPKPAS